jgi:hypothetical protein
MLLVVLVPMKKYTILLCSPQLWRVVEAKTMNVSLTTMNVCTCKFLLKMCQEHVHVAWNICSQLHFEVFPNPHFRVCLPTCPLVVLLFANHNPLFLIILREKGGWRGQSWTPSYALACKHCNLFKLDLWCLKKYVIGAWFLFSRVFFFFFGQLPMLFGVEAWSFGH